MKTFYAEFETKLLSVGYEIVKIDDYWTLLDNGDAVMENVRRGDLLHEAYELIGE